MPDMQNQSTENQSPKKVVIIGAGGHGRVIADIVSLAGDVVLGFLDDKDPSEFPNITILGKLTDIERFKQEASFIVGIGNNQLRKQIMETFDVDWYTAIHPTAVITSDVVIGEANAYATDLQITCICWSRRRPERTNECIHRWWQKSVGEDLFDRGLCLPSDNKMTAEQQDRIIEVIRACFE